MKRLIASAVALSVIAAPAVAATTASTHPAKTSKQVKKSNLLASKTGKKGKSHNGK